MKKENIGNAKNTPGMWGNHVTNNSQDYSIKVALLPPSTTYVCSKLCRPKNLSEKCLYLSNQIQSSPIIWLCWNNEVEKHNGKPDTL